MSQNLSNTLQNILVAEDESVTRMLFIHQLSKLGFSVIAVEDGTKAWEVLQTEEAPRLVILDWSMPGIDGPTLCGLIRQQTTYRYILLVTARSRKEDIISGLDAGADDFLTKPVHIGEFHARLRVGQRLLELEETLESKIHQLSAALEHVKQLQGLLPICMHCKRVRNDEQIWERVETYIEQRSGATFSHALCNECLETYYPQEANKETQPSS
ncbi:MAG: response regulator [Proteobacteria bacterium]|nr:response regulator [Cystobacterineae bacterium]MCL2313720.1 response regulator [Pseudomonadota bacterium]